MTSHPRNVFGIVLALALTIAGCGGTAPQEESNGLPRELGAPSEALAPDETPAAVDGSPDGDPPSSDRELADDDSLPQSDLPADEAPPAADQPSSDAPDDPPPPPAGHPPPDAPGQGFRTVGNVTDRRGDHGREGPDYADIIAVTIEDDGWFAYLHTPAGFIEYPGQFRIGGSRLVFEVPWDALGSIQSAGFRTFIDWSQRRLVLNAVSQDWAPDEGTARFSR